MMLRFDEVPEFNLSTDTPLYLFLDASQIDACAQKLFQVDGDIEVEPPFMQAPYDQLLEGSPYIAEVTPEIIQWFYQQQTPPAGFFFTSPFLMEDLCSHFRQLIKIVTPHDRHVFFKMAHSEVAWVMLKNEVAHYWAVIDQAWLPTRVGWKMLTKPEQDVKPLVWPLHISERIWQQLSQVKWMDTLQVVVRHLDQHHPHLLNQEGFDGWLNGTAEEAYQRGFSVERDLLFYFSIIGLLGEDAVMSERYPDIYRLMMTPSIQTPSQRIEQAAVLAYQYSQATSEKQELSS